MNQFSRLISIFDFKNWKTQRININLGMEECALNFHAHILIIYYISKVIFFTLELSKTI